MVFVTSRNVALPDRADALAARLWFNLWARKLWPYDSLAEGDMLYWYESRRRYVVWRSRVAHVLRFPYARKDEVEWQLELTAPQAAEAYFTDGPAAGFCLAYRVEALERLSLAKRAAFRYPRRGWLRVDAQAAAGWPELVGGDSDGSGDA